MNLNAKLTKPQQELLLAAYTAKHGTYAVRRYRPVEALLRLGFIDDGKGGKGSPWTDLWFITAAGRAWLEAKKLVPPRPPESSVRPVAERE